MPKEKKRKSSRSRSSDRKREREENNRWKDMQEQLHNLQKIVESLVQEKPGIKNQENHQNDATPAFLQKD